VGGAWQGIVFRRTFSELEEMIKRAKELYTPIGGEWISGKKQFEFPNGAKVRFSYLERDNDVTRYQGHQYTWIAFDELGNYATDYPWRYMISRLRSPAGAPCYIRGTANPGGKGHAWIKARFIDGFVPGKIYRMNESGLEITRGYIPSTLDDNPILVQNDPGYSQRLKLLPTHLYRALRNGDWDVFAGQVFDEWRREKHVVKPFALDPGIWKKFYALDWGFSKPFSLGKWAVDAEGRMVRYGEWYGCAKDEINTGIRMGAEEVAAKAWAMAIQEGVSEMVADPSIWNKNDRGPSIADKFRDAGFLMIRADNDRLNGLAMVHQRMITTGEDGRPMLLVFDHCHAFIRTIPTLTPDEHHPEDVDSSLEDHVYDESRYAMMSRYAKNPVSALRKQNGNWEFRGQAGKSWDPLKRR
jgi:phage terminase large subunit